MKILIIATLTLLTMPLLAQSPVISPAVPVVNQGGTISFTCASGCGAGGTWSCTGTNSTGGAASCAGSINSSTGVYTAPSSVTAQQMLGGYQMLPNNHVFNTRIDSLSVNSNSATWIAAAATGTLNYGMDFSGNYVNNSTPSVYETLYYGAYTGGGGDGYYLVASYPYAVVQAGWLSMLQKPFLTDHHYNAINTQTGMWYELYDLYNPSGTGNVSPYKNCSACTALGGNKFTYSSYTLPVGNVNAAGTDIYPLQLHRQEIENACATSGTINHAASLILDTQQAGNSMIWPATAYASDSGPIPFGARLRLKSSVNISGFSACAQVLLTQLKQYGAILTDGGNPWVISADGMEGAPFASTIPTVFAEIAAANIPNTDFEFVDESGLEISSTSGLTIANREIVTFTRTADSVASSVDVALMGVAVNMQTANAYIAAGTGAQQLVAYCNGASNTSLTWSMSPSVGTLTSGGLYTPPATFSGASLVTTTVTATSVANSAVFATMQITILPTISSATRIEAGDTTNFTDHLGNVWYAGPLLGTGTNNLGNRQCGGFTPGDSPADPTLYENSYCTNANDIVYNWTVPNGLYNIDIKTVGIYAANYAIASYEAQGSVYFSDIDNFVAAGNVASYPADYNMNNVSVTNNNLYFAVRFIGNDIANLTAVQVTRTGSGASPSAPPSAGVLLSAKQ